MLSIMSSTISELEGSVFDTSPARTECAGMDFGIVVLDTALGA